jgi:prepilin-type N-terminal cleavage/methylation domain-containing protein
VLERDAVHLSMTRDLYRRGRPSGFTLVEMIVVVLLLSIAMLGILAVFDASARINKSEQDVADAQGAVRYGVYQMTRAIRMAGSGGLFLTQAVLNHADPDNVIGGVVVVNSAGANSYDNVEAGTVVKSLANTNIPVKPGTDMIEVRGVLLSPMFSFDAGAGNGCDAGGTNTCAGNVPVTVAATTFGALPLVAHVNDDATNRPQFAAIDAYTQGVTGGAPMLVVVSGNIDVHGGCSGFPAPQVYPQPLYGVGLITAATTLGTTGSFGNVDFGNGIAREFNNENPADAGIDPPGVTTPLRRAGVLDDLLFFVNNTDPQHPSLAQATRRGDKFDVAVIAEDVEDMQIAYGVDLNGDNRVTRTAALAPPEDIDPNVSTQQNGDEWVPNAPGETPLTAPEFQSDAAAATAVPVPFPHAGPQPAAHCPRVHGVMISLIAKSRDPDPTYRADGSLGVRVMNSPVTINAPYPDVAIYPTPPPEPHFRRRVQTLKVNLRNYSWEGN